MADSGKQLRKRVQPVKPTKIQLNALKKLKRLDRNLHMIWDKRGIPSHLCGNLSAQIEEEPEKAAHRFLSENFRLFKMKENLEDLKFIRKVYSIGACHITSQQVFGELPVYNAFTSVHIGKNKRVNKVDICYYPDLYIELPMEKGILREDAARIAIDILKGEKRLAKTVLTELLIFPKGNKYHIAWKVVVPLIKPIEEWHVFIDFTTGNLLDILDALLKATGQGRVFIPNPVVALGDRSLTAESDIPEKAYSTVLLKNLDGSGYLRGRYVDTCSTPGRTKETDLIFHYSRPDPRFKEVMAYYHINEAAQYIQGLGFTNICNKMVKVNVQGDFVNNSYYNPETREITFGTWYIDDAEDADIILHEYCHVILDDQVPDFGRNWDSCSIAEGFCDFFTACFFAEINGGFNRECIGDWNGIGRIGDCISRVDSEKHYPDDFLGMDSCDRDGEIWSAALWDIYLQMGGSSTDKAKRLAARDNTIRLIIESNFNLSVNSRFEDAAIAIIIADRNIYNSANEELIRKALVNRGILLPRVRTEIHVAVEPDEVRVGCFLIFSVTVKNTGDFSWKKAKMVISVHNGKRPVGKKFAEIINNVRAGRERSIEKSWRVPKSLKKGKYGYSVRAYYGRKKIGEAAGKFEVIT